MKAAMQVYAIKVRRWAFLLPRLPALLAWPLIEWVIVPRPAAHVMGVGIADASSSAFASMPLNKVKAALRIIAQYDPRRWRRLRNDVSRIVILDLSGAHGGHIAGSRSCIVSRQRLARDTPALIALTIVHEATHRRIDRAGIRYWPDLQSRIERRCVAEELAFAEKLPIDSFPEVHEWSCEMRRRKERDGA